ncbi:uncharacterized protein J3D65DRAFT_134260 [Phyllosticta citribraziliensis]|uniref:25S rRNA (Uridine(2843)-N(3))-methyltransferase n=1 Tax=Phyllosticta citribraziliensis TaxID=989973 RepID=A0ABR1L7Q5_9PEZI
MAPAGKPPARGLKQPSKSKKEGGRPASKHQDKTKHPSISSPKTGESVAKSALGSLQSLLNTFRNAFEERLASDVKPLLQQVKQHLYNRDFLEAFGRDDYLEAYAVRWSPSRALGYAQIFEDLQDRLLQRAPGTKDAVDSFRVVCLGGGAGAEIVGLAGFSHHLIEESNNGPISRMDVTAIDIANWSSVVTSLQAAITSPPPLSKYASAAAKEANKELLTPEAFHTRFLQQDVLSMDPEKLSVELRDATLVTIMFTLNELYTASMAKTQRFLLMLTETLAPGAQLLVVDSPGSYSTVTLNGAEKKYPMHWILDHTLLSTTQAPKWEKTLEDESRWFRLPEGLKYPIELENMRYQIHLYKRLPQAAAVP